MASFAKRTWSRQLAATGTLLSFLSSAVCPSLAWAQSDPPTDVRADLERVEESIDDTIPSREHLEAAASAHAARVDEPIDDTVASKEHLEAAASAVFSQGEGQDEPAQSEAANPGPLTPKALPSGADKSGVTSQAISMPTGSGTIQGMGESFSAQLSTGIATFSVPLSIPPARGGAQASLGLSYSSGSGLGQAGMGWDVGVPFIARQTDRGVPGYDDRASWHENQDSFVFNGGQELVPICTVTGDSLQCDGALDGEEMPRWSKGHQYFRPRVEGSFLRFFWSVDHLTWRVQDKSGVTMELGVPLDGSGDAAALERNPDEPGEIFRWGLVRQYDTYGDANPAVGNPEPHNVVVYKYTSDGGMVHVSDIFHTTPAADPTTKDTSKFAHHVRLVYETRTDQTESYRSGWKIESRLRLKRLDVASKPFQGTANEARRQVRRYHLRYAPSFHASLLESVQLEGRCAADEDDAPAETGNQALPETTGCETLPPLTFGYSHVAPFKTDGSQGVADLEGFEGFDERLIQIAASPNHSVDEELADLFDINSDALPDVLVTAPGTYNDNHAVFFNGPGGVANKFGGATELAVKGVLGADSNTIKLSNPNVALLDLDGDGMVDLLHMPKFKTYSVYTSRQTGGKWEWAGRVVDTTSGQDVKIDFGQDAAETRVVDVNFDGLVDVVVSTGTEFQTFYSLGRYAGGDGQFGSASWATNASSTISNSAVPQCVPWSSTPVRFSDDDIQLAEMNGDGIPDIVRIRRGDIRYWPGRGNGVWGTGRRDDCPAGTFSSNRYEQMATSPYYSDIQGTTLRVDDVNGDGLDDLVQVRTDAVDVWLNVDGKGWTADRHIIENTPNSPSYAQRVRLTDVNGSGTRDVLWGNAQSYEYMDLTGGIKPAVLVRVENGLGKSTDLEYSTSSAEMLAAEATGKSCSVSGEPFERAWCSKMPMVTHVVKRVTESDNLDVAGQGPRVYTTEYSYRDPVYEGRQREFRGFRRARAVRVGDSNSPTDITETSFLLGECEDETVGVHDNGIDDCSVPERWRDNPKEALKGLPTLTERFDENGVYLSSALQSYRLRHLYTGLDGRAVRHAFQSATATYVYDTAPFSPGGAGLEPRMLVELEKPFGATPLTTTSLSFQPRSPAMARIETEAFVDEFGNQTSAVAKGCTSCVPADEVITATSDPAPVPNNETSWLWRTMHSFTEGDIHPGARNETFTTYATKGNPLDTTAVLQGTEELERFHSGTGAVAPPPAEASENGLILLSTRTYDEDLGTLTQETGANERCRAVGYDAVYQTLATVETIYTHGCDDPENGLSAAAGYDRGLGLITTAIDMQGQPSRMRYDQFGRLTSILRPHPTLDGQLSEQPSVIVQYLLPSADNGLRYTRIYTLTHDGESTADSEYLESWAYIDGFGRTLVTLTEADPAAGDGGQWVAGSFSEYDAKSTVRRKYMPYFYDGEGDAFPITSAPGTPYGRQRYDAFARQVQTFDLDGTVTLESRYHALSSDLWDAADLTPGPHQGSYASDRRDGHGRTVAVVQRLHVSGVIEAREVRTDYLATGEPEVITRVRVGHADAPVVRWMRYDTFGRVVLNVEPNTTKNFTPDKTTTSSDMKAWRYVYNDAGDLVGTSDARGCGVNFAYDRAGRLLSEDYSPCEPHHEPYSEQPEVLYVYDRSLLEPVPGIQRPAELVILNEDPFEPGGRYFRGRLAAVFDRASATWTSYDGRGSAIQSAVRVAKPLTASLVDNQTLPDPPAFADRYASDVSVKSFAFDAADREIAASTGIEGHELQGSPAPEVVGLSWFTAEQAKSVVTTEYTRRGTMKSADGSYGSLVASIKRQADGLITELIYGDAAGTTTSSSYDNRRRLRSIQTYRGPPSTWTTPPPAPSGAASTFQLLLQDEDYLYDVVNNPIEIRDWRLAEEWPDGAKPVTKKVQYDDIYRVTRVDYEYPSGDDAWVSPFAAENSGDTAQQDPRRAKPTPHVAFERRILRQTHQYDWLGNTKNTDDDARGFYDRSLGNITNDIGAKPYQLKSAAQASGPRGGELNALYDDAGNLTRLDIERAGVCLPEEAACSQRFDYRWDEVGRLLRARRWDVAGVSIGSPSDALPDTAAAADLNYTYDVGDQRVLKTAFDDAGEASHSVYLFDSLELRRATYDTETNQFERSKFTEVGYLSAHGVRLARLVYDEAEIPAPGAAKLHIFLELGDHLGSTSIVIDKATSELVERSTFQANGGAESDYRPERWKSFREDYRFTGKEEDVEVGLQYFGKRYLNPLLGRWISADPLAIHSVGDADLNLYAYVVGRILKAIDPLGLEPKEVDDAAERSVCTDEGDGLPPGAETGMFVDGLGAGAQAALVEGFEGMADGLPVSDTPRPDAKPPIQLTEDAKPDVPSSDAGQLGFKIGYVGMFFAQAAKLFFGKPNVRAPARQADDVAAETHTPKPPPRAAPEPAPNATTPSAAAAADSSPNSSGPKVKSRLPRSDGSWDGTPGESNWHSTNPEVLEATKGRPVPFVDGRPDFSKFTLGTLRFKPGVLNGTGRDFEVVKAAIKESLKLKSPAAAEKWMKKMGVTAHHKSDTEIQLVFSKVHNNVPHIGSASDMRNAAQ